MAKIPTVWLPPSHQGYVVPQTGIFFQDNLGNLLVTNTLANFVPTPYYTIGKIATAWSQA